MHATDSLTGLLSVCHFGNLIKLVQSDSNVLNGVTLEYFIHWIQGR